MEFHLLVPFWKYFACYAKSARWLWSARCFSPQCSVKCWFFRGKNVLLGMMLNAPSFDASKKWEAFLYHKVILVKYHDPLAVKNS